MASKNKSKRKKKSEIFEDKLFESDDTFAFIAGYTSGGVPYGVTWEEMEEMERMYCSCPYAADGRNCKHMAAVLFKFEEMLDRKDLEREDDAIVEHSSSLEDFYPRHQREKEEVTELISKIPEDKVRELLAGFVLADERFKHNIQMQYDFQMNSKLMLELRTEVDQIVYRHSNGGYVDWYHASEFTSELESFLNTKVMLLIEKKCLKQEFELTNLVFRCIGNIDMDDSDGGSSFVANVCYDCWEYGETGLCD